MEIDWAELTRIRKKRKAEEEFDRLHGPRRYKTVDLPKSEWHRCPSCNGTGSYLEQGDLHRSSGWVPCGCGDGTVRTKVVEIKRRVKVKAGSERV